MPQQIRKQNQNKTKKTKKQIGKHNSKQTQNIMQKTKNEKKKTTVKVK